MQKELKNNGDRISKFGVKRHGELKNCASFEDKTQIHMLSDIYKKSLP